ncbi:MULTISPECIES: hypothetical protein [unclassified Tenacibaculum]|uniref:hypothetical protein n=1 Tax=unclassified Tenacibaculum TaxID=2635139 RepID=UPI001F1AAFBD|nr:MULTISPECIES: hypothetical protein [unclassified Tenacibaculum]MCF2873145.1 hypothetical protein [Tenacibaculum sp. Cn5-1]MCF2933301.1 hypothetical protein [Tenacibaculum sp. Cn5-34]MCG7510118.1 hypothetical protein [Tenacibaculum sp. Cn5-46]
MDVQKKNKNLLSQVLANKNKDTVPGVITLVKELMEANSSESNTLKIEELNLKIHAAFLLAREKELNASEKAFDKIILYMNDLFNYESFEFYCSQLLYLPGKSYLEFKKGERDSTISMVKKSIEYAVTLQNYSSSHNIGVYISQMLDNLARVYLVFNEIKEWQNIVLENIHFLTNNHLPSFCENFIPSHDFSANPHKHLMLIGIINNTIMSIVRNNLITENNLINSIVLTKTSEPLIKQINKWVLLNRLLTKQEGGTKSFEMAYNEFLSYKNNKHDNLRILKLYLKSRIKKERVQLYSNQCLMIGV